MTQNLLSSFNNLRLVATTKSKEPWDVLRKAYQGRDKVKVIKLQSLSREFETLCMRDSESMQYLCNIFSLELWD